MVDESSVDLVGDAANWASDIFAMTDMFGGYPGPVYEFRGVIFIVDPGNESTKYAQLLAFNPDDLVAIYQKYESMHDSEDEYYDVYKALYEADLIGGEGEEEKTE